MSRQHQRWDIAVVWPGGSRRGSQNAARPPLTISVIRLTLALKVT
jgi:hypothetical protein